MGVNDVNGELALGWEKPSGAMMHGIACLVTRPISRGEIVGTGPACNGDELINEMHNHHIELHILPYLSAWRRRVPCERQRGRCEARHDGELFRRDVFAHGVLENHAILCFAAVNMAASSTH